MILDFFQQRSIKRFGFIVVSIVILFWQKITILAEPESLNTLLPLDNFIYSIANTNLLLSVIIKLSLLLICSYAFIIMLTPQDLLPSRKYLAAFLFLSILSVFTTPKNIVYILLSLTLLMLAFHHVFSTYRSDSIKSLIFVAAFFVGLATMLSLPCIFSILYLIVGAWIFSDNAARRSIFIIIFGFFTPIFFLLCFYQLTYHDLNLLHSNIENNFNNLISSGYDFDDFRLFFACFTILFTTASALKIYIDKRAKIVQKKANFMFFVVFLISTFIAVFVPGMKFYTFSFLGISSAYLIARFSQVVKREFIAEIIIFAIFIAAAIYNNISLLSI